MCRATLVPVQLVIDSLGEDLASDLAVLVAGTGCLRLYDDSGGEMLQLDCRVGLVLREEGVLVSICIVYIYKRQRSDEALWE